LKYQCRNCQFFKATQGKKGSGQCRRYPPPFTAEQTAMLDAFPPVSENDFCVQFERARTRMYHQCENCKFFKELESRKRRGECHRYPPVVANVDKSNEAIQGIFPLVRNDNFCGEFTDRESL